MFFYLDYFCIAICIIERIRVVKLFNDLPYGSKSKFARTSLNAKNNYGIFISERGVRQKINKWDQTKSVADLPRKIINLNV